MAAKSSTSKHAATAGDRWTPQDAIECYLRDCILNRGAGGAASIYQMALGVPVDGDVGPITMDADEQARAAAFCRRYARRASATNGRSWDVTSGAASGADW